MANYRTNTLSLLGSAAFFAIARTVGEGVNRAIDRLGRERHLRRDIAALNAVDDHLLADMGLSRAEIGPAVRGRNPPGTDPREYRRSG